MSINEDYLREACKEAYGAISASDTLKEKVISKDILDARKGLLFGKFGMVAAIVIGCIVLAGGAAVYAFGHEAFREYFFGKDSINWEEVYNSVGKEYSIGKHKLVFNGAIYDETLLIGYLDFEIQDLDGTPTKDKVEFNFSRDELWRGLCRNVYTEPICVGDEMVVIVLTYSDAIMGFLDDSNLFFKYSKNSKHADKGVTFTVLNEDEYKRLKSEIEALDYETVWGIKSGNQEEIYTICPEVQDILDKYDFEEVYYKEVASQTVCTESCIVIFGQTDFSVYFNLEAGINSISFRREDGTVMEIIKDNEVQWKGLKGSLWREKGTVYGRNIGWARCTLQYGFLLPADEEMTVIIDGMEYK